MTTNSSLIPLNIIAWICAGILFLALLPFPSWYYWVLRWVVTLGALIIAWNKRKDTSKLLVFLLIAYLFNPVIPIFTYEKYKWIVVDLICGILFILETQKKAKKSNVKVSTKRSSKAHGRDKYY
ncbi:DUF6804 family protein [Gilvibacter sediminis]|uniref:DUF6804 family protein n=1 Tax=Gilvibacter sediminis TaxID=379071 RepID=UPI003AF325BC